MQSSLVGDNEQRSQGEFYAEYCLKLAEKYGFRSELDRVIRQSVNPNDKSVSEAVDQEMLGIYGEITGRKPDMDLGVAREIFRNLIHGQDLGELQGEIA